MTDKRNDRRSHDRIAREISVRYYVKQQSLRYQECALQDISLTGAKVRIPRYEKVSTGSRIFLEVLLTGSGEQINLNGTVQWVARHKQILLCGIQFNRKLDGSIIAKL